MTTGLRILHVISSGQSTGGGPIEALTRLATQLGSMGHTIDLVCLDEPTQSDSPAPFGEVVRLGRGIGKYRFNLKLMKWMRENASRYDAIVVNGLWQFHSLGVALAMKKIGRRYFAYSHGMLDPWFKRRYPLKHLKKVAYWILAERFVVNSAQAIIFTSEAERILARQSFPFYEPREIVTVYGTAPPPDKMQMQLSLQGAASNRADDPRKIILFMSRIHEKKGCDMLISAFAALGERRRDYRLVIAGPDQEGLVDKLKRQADALGVGADITWPGMVTGSKKWGLLHSADVFCLPSHQENFGVVVAEAMACGVPVLLTDKVNIWHEVVESGSGIVQDDTVAGITALLDQWTTLDASKRNSMRSAALDCFNRSFHIEGVAARYLQIVAGVDVKSDRG